MHVHDVDSVQSVTSNLCFREDIWSNDKNQSYVEYISKFHTCHVFVSPRNRKTRNHKSFNQARYSRNFIKQQAVMLD